MLSVLSEAFNANQQCLFYYFLWPKHSFLIKIMVQSPLNMGTGNIATLLNHLSNK